MSARRTAIVRAALATAFFALPGCSSSGPQAGIEVIVETNLAPTSYGQVQLVVQQQSSTGGWVQRASQPLQGSLPTRFAIAPGSSADQDVLITITADSSSGTPLVRSVVQVNVPTTYVAQLDVDLVATQASCKGTWTAAQGTEPATCTLNLNDAGPLPQYQAGTSSFDAGPMDATIALTPDAPTTTKDAGRDTTVADAQPDVAMLVDAKGVDARGVDAKGDTTITDARAEATTVDARPDSTADVHSVDAKRIVDAPSDVMEDVHHDAASSDAKADVHHDAGTDSGVVRYADCEQFLGSGSTTGTQILTGLYYPGGGIPDHGTLYVSNNGSIVTSPTTGGASIPYYTPGGGFSPVGIAVDQTYVYWTQNPGGTAWRCEKSGCTAPTMIASGSTFSNGPGIMRTDGVNVCWTTGGGITCVTAGPTADPVLSITGEANTVGISMCRGYVIWSNMVTNGTVRIAEVSKTGKAATLAEGLATPDGVASDGTYVYAVTTGSPGGTQQTLLKLPMNVFDASAPQAIFTGPGQQWSGFVALRGSWVYWTDQFAGVVRATPTTGGTTVTIAQGQSPYPLFINTDTTTVYWVESDDPASIFTAPLQATP